MRRVDGAEHEASGQRPIFQPLASDDTMPPGASSPRTPVPQDRVWMLRSAFDTMLDELGEDDDNTTVDDVSNAENSRFASPTRRSMFGAS